MPLKIDKKILMTNGSLMKVESNAECSHTFDLHYKAYQNLYFMVI